MSVPEAKVEKKPTRRFQRIHIKEECRVANRIMDEVVGPEMEMNPMLNLCMIRSLCEKMHSFVHIRGELHGPDDMAGQTCEAQPSDTYIDG